MNLHTAAKTVQMRRLKKNYNQLRTAAIQGVVPTKDKEQTHFAKKQQNAKKLLRERGKLQRHRLVLEPSKQDFKPVSFTFNAEELHKNNRLTCESTTVHNTLANEANARDYRREIDFALSQELCQFSPERGQNCTFEPNNSKSPLGESNDTSGTDNTGEQLPQICINDHLMVTSPPPISVTLNNNIEKMHMDKNSIAIGSTQSLQISPSLNIITSENNLTGDGAQSISVKLGNLNGVQITCDHVTPSVRRASTDSATC